MAEELVDILNEKGEKTGKVETKNNAHRLGLIHLAVHVWLLNSKGRLLLQKRAKNKESHPGLWDISAAGHVSAGQTSVEAAQRETQEELGLNLPEKSFQYLFSVEQHIILNNGTFINNEFNDIYLVRSDLDTSGFKLQTEEVEEVRWLDIEVFKKWIEGKGEPMVPNREEYKKLLEYLS